MTDSPFRAIRAKCPADRPDRRPIFCMRCQITKLMVLIVQGGIPVWPSSLP
jgi:hypothetical protein